MKTSDERHAPLMFTVALSFLLGIITTIAVYSFRVDTPSSPIEQAESVAVSEPVAASEAVEPAKAANRSSSSEPGVLESLRARDLRIPVDDVEPDDLHDTFTDARGSRSHEALDILAPRGTHVVAVENGRIEKLFTSKAGGLTIYQFDPTGTFAYYYAHLDRYADRLVEGQTVKRGDVLGYVGSTGNASPDAPHLHFGIFRLGPERQWWKGEPINPYLVLARK
jgi:murein DD-endopeptidase MepM/ murein hydrolase activator NlpD